MNFLLPFFQTARNPTPFQLAVWAGLNTSAFLAIILLIIKLLCSDCLDWWLVILLPIVVFLSAAYSMHEALRLFIYRKIKIIYKSIHEIKAPKNRPPLKVNMRHHVIDQVEREVVEWAKDWNEEIRYLKKNETYRKEFVGNVSHELKTPIFNIQGYLETLVEDELKDTEFVRKYLQKSLDNVERMAAIVSDLGEIARLESGEISLHLSRFNVVKLCKMVFEEVELLAAQQKVRLGIKGRPTEIWAYADESKIRQVLNNLITNAIKYNRPEEGQVWVGFYDMDERVLIEVTDSGVGIAPEHLPRVFERFYRIDKSRSRAAGGSGLGLAIVKHIIEAHQQTVHARSRLGQGSTFGFTLGKGES